MSAALIPIEEWHTRTAGWVQVAANTDITNHADYQQAGADLQAVKGLQTEAATFFDPIIVRAYEAHREALAQKKRAVEPLVQAETLLKQKIGAWVDYQESLRRAEEERLRQQAEREALEAREREIEAAEELGADADEIQAIAAAPIERRPIVTQPAPKVAGISAREMWKAEVNNMRSFIAWVAEHPEYTNLLQPNMTALQGIARSLRQACNIPGVRVWRESSIAASRR